MKVNPDMTMTNKRRRQKVDLIYQTDRIWITYVEALKKGYVSKQCERRDKRDFSGENVAHPISQLATLYANRRAVFMITIVRAPIAPIRGRVDEEHPWLSRYLEVDSLYRLSTSYKKKKLLESLIHATAAKAV